MKLCPQCATRAAVDAGVDVRALRLGPVQSGLLGALLAAPGRVVITDELIDAAWGCFADGGPEGARRGVSAHIHHLRRRLAGLPVRKRNIWGIGYKLTREA
jgi:DNA-binding response OmpR family regulator